MTMVAQIYAWPALWAHDEQHKLHPQLHDACKLARRLSRKVLALPSPPSAALSLPVLFLFLYFCFWRRSRDAVDSTAMNNWINIQTPKYGHELIKTNIQYGFNLLINASTATSTIAMMPSCVPYETLHRTSPGHSFYWIRNLGNGGRLPAKSTTGDVSTHEKTWSAGHLTGS